MKKIVLIGDFNQSITAHVAIPKALELAAKETGIAICSEWIDTKDINQEHPENLLNGSHGMWVVPGSPYENLPGALAAIGWARENNVPYLGTCGGYQHAVLEFAIDVLGYDDAENSEVNPDAKMPLIAPLSCELVEKAADIHLDDASDIAKYYGATRISETYRCRYGFNKAYADIFKGSDLRISGWDEDGDPRAIELVGHPFFVGTAFQPERSALSGQNHPLISAFVKAVGDYIA